MFALLLAHLALASAQIEPCAAVPGQELLWSNPSTSYVIFGETHGTAELPALFGDVVCSISDGPVVVGLEYPRSHQPAIDAYMASDGSAAARAALGWPADQNDGRTSLAMLNLLDRLRTLKASGADISVIAFAPIIDRATYEAEGQKAHERGMAQSWSEIASQYPRARLLIYVGNLHAAKTVTMGVRPAAMYLPAEEVLSIVDVLTGGQAWNCQDEGCGPHPVPGTGEAFGRGIRLTAVRDGGRIRYDGRYSPGGPAMPSPPATLLRDEER